MSSQPLIVDFKQKQAINKVVPNSPVISSDSTQWRDITLNYVVNSGIDRGYEVPEHRCRQHTIVIATDIDKPIYRERRIDGKFATEQLVNGNVCFCPVNHSHWAYARPEKGEKSSAIVISLEPGLFSCSIPESVEPDTVELIPHFMQPDPLIHQISLALKAELELNPHKSRFYAESMAIALSAHLIQRYTADKHLISDCLGGLSKYQLKRAIDYIQAHFTENIPLEATAAEVGISRFYFCRLFKQSTGITPHQYLIKCRIDRAKILLKQHDNSSIAKIALEVGFSNQSHFTKHFKRLVGTTPKKFRVTNT